MKQYHFFSNAMIERANKSLDQMAQGGVCVTFKTRNKSSAVKGHKLNYRYKGVICPKEQGAKNGFCTDAEKKLHAALLLIAQTPVGQTLIQRCFDARYSFIFNDKKLTDANCGALCDPGTRLIELPTTQSVAKLALTIVHEMAHASQFEQSSLILHASKMQDPKFYLSLFYALEADARAQELLFALEYTEALSHKRKVKDDSASNPVLNTLKKSYPLLTDNGMRRLFAYEELTDEAKREALQAAFLAFYDCKGLRLFYEGMYVDEVLQKRDMDFNNRFVDLRPGSVRIKGRQIVEALNDQAPLAYLGDELDLSSAHFFAISRKSHGRLAEKYGWGQANKLDILEDDDLLDRGSGGHVKDAANFFFKGCHTSFLKYAIDTMDVKLFEQALKVHERAAPVIGKMQEHYLLYAIRRMGHVRKNYGEEGAQKAKKFFKAMMSQEHKWREKQKASGLTLLEEAIAAISVFELQDICKEELSRFVQNELVIAKKAFKANKIFRIYATKHHKDILGFWNDLVPVSAGRPVKARFFK